MTTAAQEAASWLKFAEKGYQSKFGSVPLEVRLDLARAWIDLNCGAKADTPNQTNGSEA